MKQFRTFSPLGWLCVWLLPILLVAAMVVAMVAGSPPSGVAFGPHDGGDGVGDPYFPLAGGGGYDALSYAIDVSWDESAGILAGSTTLTARATRDLSTFHVDLAYEGVTAEVDGRRASVTPGVGTDRAITPERVIRAGRTFTAHIFYAGDPTAGVPPEVAAPVSFARAAVRADGELVVAGEPTAAAAWFPANDHPSDPATFDLRVRVPAGREALSTGRLVSRDDDDDPATATWHWVTDRPVATYLTFLAVGDFVLDAGVDQGRPYVYAVSETLGPDAVVRALVRLRTTGAVVRELETRYGPYPYGELGGVVVGPRLWFAGLECATRPVYDRSLARSDGWPEELLVHELAHMWFGDHTSVATWADIVNNEGWATFVQNDQAARAASDDPNVRLKRTWDRVPPREWRASISDPGIGNMFGTTYARGGAALQALRNVVGEEQYFGIAREWAQLGAPRTLADFQRLVEQRTGRDLAAFWSAWYDAPTAPPKTAGYGYP